MSRKRYKFSKNHAATATAAPPAGAVKEAKPAPATPPVATGTTGARDSGASLWPTAVASGQRAWNEASGRGQTCFAAHPYRAAEWAKDLAEFPPVPASPRVRELTPGEVRTMYGPARSLGGSEDLRVAMDSALEESGVYGLMAHTLDLGQGVFPQFMGYGALQNISQNGLIRACIGTVADDMTREWIKLQREGESDTAKLARKDQGQNLPSFGVADGVPEDAFSPEYQDEEEDFFDTLSAAPFCLYLDESTVFDEQPRKRNGQFGSTGGSASLERTKAKLKDCLNYPAQELPSIPATRENFRKLAPGGIVDTPIGRVKFGENQFEKLVSESTAGNREKLFGAMFDVLQDPDVIVAEENDERGPARLFAKSYRHGTGKNLVVSVVVEQNKIWVSISTHQKTVNNVVNKIKTSEQIITNRFERDHAIDLPRRAFPGKSHQK